MENTLKHKVSGKLIICVGAVFLFSLASLLFIKSPQKKIRSEFRAAELEQITTEDGDKTRSDYVNQDGVITIAADKGYATSIITKTEDGEYEEYLDDRGNPISTYSGYYAVFREYDELGNNVRTTYLDNEGKPVRITSGYASIRKEFDEDGRVIVTRYYNVDDTPILTLSGYAKSNEYNEEGRIIRITYLDENDHPLVTSQGYASVSRTIYTTEDQNNGKVENEFYFDEEGNPTRLSLGEYGLHMEYDVNGKQSVLTYLDADGSPMMTNKGYSSVRRTYHANGSIATERYFGLNGKPCALAEGQYGRKIENGQTAYLNADGSEQFNIKNYLYNHSWAVIIAAALLIIISAFLPGRWNVLLLTLYIEIIFYFTLLFRDAGNSDRSIHLFWYYKHFLTDSEARSDILKNIWLFIPLGAILHRLCQHKWIMLVPVVLSMFIEVTQYVTGTGLCEVDDVISNGLGGVIGYGVGVLMTLLLFKDTVQDGRRIKIRGV